MDSLRWLTELVAFDTTSHKSNLELINHIASFFKEKNIPCRLTYDDEKTKANIVATIPAEDGSVNGGLVLSGHTDVVPIDGQDWDTDPFILTQKENYLFGRGTCDMKGFIAVVLAMVPEIQTMKLSKPLHMAFSYDEEVGCLGAPLLIEDLQQQGIQPEACIVGEPTEMRPVIAHKGINVFRCSVHGRAAHSSLTSEGCNAIEYAAQFICKLRQIAHELRHKGEADGSFDIPFTSMSTNMIQGGNAINTIPALCEVWFEFRNLPTMAPKIITTRIQHFIQKELLPAMQTEYPDAQLELTPLATVPGLQAEKDDPFSQLIYALTKEEGTLKVAYGTEGGLFQQAGIPTLICGPGSIQQAHRANEFLEVTQLNACEQFIRTLIQHYLVIK